MVTFTSVLVALAGATTIFANPIGMGSSLQNLIRGALTPPGAGMHDGFYYSFWTDGKGSVNYTNEAGGKYSVAWSDIGNFVAGKGWADGTGRNVTYSGSWDGAEGVSYISLFGEMDIKPVTLWYIMDNFGTWDPKTAQTWQSKGNYTADGDTYTILITMTGDGINSGTIRYIYSVRHEKRVGGTINVQAHLDAWVKAGLKLGPIKYQILATEAYQYKSYGSATITVEGP